MKIHHPMIKSIFYWSMLFLLYCVTVFFSIDYISGLKVPLGTSVDFFKTILYGAIFSGAIFYLLYGLIKFYCSNLLLDFKAWVSLGINLQLRGGKRRSLRWVVFFLFFIGEFVLLGTVPLYINEQYATARPVHVQATVIKKSEFHRLRGVRSHTLIVNSESGESFDMSHLYNQLNVGDSITMIVRQGCLGIYYCMAIYKRV